MLFEQRKVSSQLQGFWHSLYKFRKNNNTGGERGEAIRLLFMGRRRKRICFKKKKKENEKSMVGVAFFSAAQFLASLQWQNTAYKKKTTVQFATHAHTQSYIYGHTQPRLQQNCREQALWKT